MPLHSITKNSRKNYQTVLLVLAFLWMLLQANKERSLAFGCDEKEKQVIELNVGLKDFFFKYPNL